MEGAWPTTMPVRQGGTGGLSGPGAARWAMKAGRRLEGAVLTGRLAAGAVASGGSEELVWLAAHLYAYLLLISASECLRSVRGLGKGLHLAPGRRLAL